MLFLLRVSFPRNSIIIIIIITIIIIPFGSCRFASPYSVLQRLFYVQFQPS
jgi:hypothetical protein